MDNALILSFLPVVLLVVVIGLLLWLRPRNPAAELPDPAEKAVLATRLAEAERQLAERVAEAGPLRQRLEQALAGQAGAEARQAALEAELAKAQQAMAQAQAERDNEARRRVEAERHAALAQQKLVDFEQLSAQMTEAAKAATLESSKLLAGQLLESHKREAEAAKQQQEAQRQQQEASIKQTTEALYQRFEQVTGSVAALGAQVTQTQITTETIRRAISHPGGAGRMAEIGLENLLKSFGLEPGMDFIVQYHAAGDGERGALRPDAVVFLPGDAALVIDSKASKTLLDHAEAESEAEAEAALARLGQRMNQHLRALSAKDYGKAVLDSYKSLGRGGTLSRCIIAMALPNEAAVEKLRQADPALERLAAEKDIVIAGPSALAAIIAMARMNIHAGRQSENQEKIATAMRDFLDSLATALAAAEKSAKGLATAAEQFDAFTRSVNRRLLPRARTLIALGVGAKKSLPQALPSFEVTVGRNDVIDAEAEEVASPQLEKPA